jgi:colanic acid biosynthesis glycosyl transferase WcaI
MPRVLILNQVFPPDRVSSGDIFAEIAVELKAMGHEVSVLTTVPHFNRDPGADLTQRLRPVWGPLLYKSDFRGVPVYHTLMPPKARTLWRRALGWTGFHLISIAAAVTVVPRPDVVIVVSPPLTIGFAGWAIARLRGAKYAYNVQELYPDLAVRLGAIRNPRLISALYLMERFVYQHAAAVVPIGEKMAAEIRKKAIPGVTVRVIPNPADNIGEAHEPKDNAFSRFHAVNHKFVVTYAGNIGRAQGLDTFVDAADQLRHMTDIHFMMMGSGVYQRDLEERVARAGLSNFTSLPYQPNDRMPQIYGASDLCLVPLAAGIGSHALPSKVYRTMAAARPVLGIADSDSELAWLIQRAECGWVVPPNNAMLLAETILSASQRPDQVRRKAYAGRAYVSRWHTRQAIVNQYDDLIWSVAGQRQARQDAG